MEGILFIHGHEYDKMNLFSKMANEFINRDNNVKILSFSRFEKLVYKKNGLSKEIIFMPKELKKYSDRHIAEYTKYNDIELDDMIRYNYIFNKSNNYKVNKKYYNNLCKIYLEFLRETIKKYNISKFVMWNNSYIFDRIAWYFAKKNNIEIVVMEQGFFRPFTITTDFNGVNYENSMPREKLFYENVSVNHERLEKYLTNPESYNLINFNNLDKKGILIKNIQRYMYMLLDKLNFKLKLDMDCRIINYNFFDLLKKYTRKANKNYDVINLESKYILIPFQVEDDSQIILNSPNINSMEELIEIINGLSISFKEYHFIFKQHPVSKVCYDEIYKKYEKNDRLIFLKTGDTEQLIYNAEAVITVNSTVGIEALIKGKKVMTLGNAFFNIEGIVKHCSNLEEINQKFSELMHEELNKELINKFLYYLRFNYQKEFFWRNPSEKQIKDLITYLE